MYIYTTTFHPHHIKVSGSMLIWQCMWALWGNTLVEMLMVAKEASIIFACGNSDV